MKQNRGYPIVSVTRKAENSIQTGHPWVYNTEIVKTEGTYQNGDGGFNQSAGKIPWYGVYK